MKIEQQIVSGVVAAVSELYGQQVAESQVQLQKTRLKNDIQLSEGVADDIKYRFAINCWTS